MIVQHQMFVIREAVLMHVDYLTVDPTLFVNQVFIQQNAFVCLVLLEIHNPPVTNVSRF